MNLREKEGYLLSLLGDPNRDEIGRGDVFRALNIGQQVVARNLMTVDREFFQKEVPYDDGDATNDMDLPVDFLEPVRVTVNGNACKRLASRDIDAITENPLFRATEGYQQFYVPLLGTAGRSKLRVFPDPGGDAGDNVTVTYIARPVDFHELGSDEGAVDASPAPSTTSFADASIAKADTVGFWDNATVRITSSSTCNGEIRRVTDHATGGVFTVYPAFSAAPAATDTFEIDQTSIIPPQYHDLVPLYGAGLMAHKVGVNRDRLMGRYLKELQALAMRLAGNINPALPGEMPVPDRQRSITP